MSFALVILVSAALALAFIGHTALWVSVVNRLNAYAFPHAVLRWVNRTCLFCCAVIPLVAAAWVTYYMLRIAYAERMEDLPPNTRSEELFSSTFAVYCWICWCVAIWAMLVWIVRRLNTNPARFFVRMNHTERFDVARLRGESLAGNRKAALCARIPGNQIFQFHTQTKELVLPGLPAALDGFSIVHLSDLHFAGHVRREFHEEVIRQTNLLDADLIALTGDIIDRPHCFAWFAVTLGQLRARQGVYFVLGNHESRRCAPGEIRQVLGELGLVDLGGKSALIEHRGAKILLAGNELPWLAAPLAAGALPASPSDPEVLSIALSHSPDQFAWAQREGYQLMLAGHVHGGQICPPVIGPMLSPSRYGVRYAGGTFFRPPTLLHVTRGVSGMIPLRFNCPPEVAKLVLRAAS